MTPLSSASAIAVPDHQPAHISDEATAHPVLIPHEIPELPHDPANPRSAEVRMLLAGGIPAYPRLTRT
jgi:hypothetical protein